EHPRTYLGSHLEGGSSTLVLRTSSLVPFPCCHLTASSINSSFVIRTSSFSPGLPFRFGCYLTASSINPSFVILEDSLCTWQLVSFLPHRHPDGFGEGLEDGFDLVVLVRAFSLHAEVG